MLTFDLEKQQTIEKSKDSAIADKYMNYSWVLRFKFNAICWNLKGGKIERKKGFTKKKKNMDKINNAVIFIWKAIAVFVM